MGYRPLLMNWWKRLCRRLTDKSLVGATYRVICTLYSADGKRSAEIRKFSNGDTYLLESEWVEEGKFEGRHAGRLVGPFASPTAAERFIAATSWFKGTE